MASAHAESDLDILQEVELPLDEFMGESAARALLAIRFSPQATKRLERLLGKNANGSITAEERLLLEKYLRVGSLIDIIQAKARLAISKSRESS